MLAIESVASDEDKTILVGNGHILDAPRRRCSLDSHGGRWQAGPWLGAGSATGGGVPYLGTSRISRMRLKMTLGGSKAGVRALAVQSCRDDRGWCKVAEPPELMGLSGALDGLREELESAW